MIVTDDGEKNYWCKKCGRALKGLEGMILKVLWLIKNRLWSSLLGTVLVITVTDTFLPFAWMESKQHYYYQARPFRKSPHSVGGNLKPLNNDENIIAFTSKSMCSWGTKIDNIAFTVKSICSWCTRIDNITYTVKSMCLWDICRIIKLLPVPGETFREYQIIHKEVRNLT